MSREKLLTPLACALLLCCAVLASATVARAAETFPDRPVHIVVPFTAGGVVDVVARVIGEKLSAKYGQPVIVDNKPGAGGSIGTEFVAKSAPDGYTMLMVGPGLAVLPSVMKSLPWSPSDFRAVLGIGSVPNIVVVNADVPVKDMAGFIALAKTSPTPLSYGSPGIGSTPHLSGELLAQMAHVKLLHVPYRGQPDAVKDLLAGRLTFMPLTAALAEPLVKAGKLRALAVTGSKRSSIQPALPTVAEAAGLPGYDVRPWTAVFVPARTSDAVAGKLAADMIEVLGQADVKEKMRTIGMELAPQPLQEFDAFVAEEIKRWSEVVRKAGIQPE